MFHVKHTIFFYSMFHVKHIFIPLLNVSRETYLLLLIITQKITLFITQNISREIFLPILSIISQEIIIYKINNYINSMFHVKHIKKRRINFLLFQYYYQNCFLFQIFHLPLLYPQ